MDFADLTVVGSLFRRDFARLQDGTVANVPPLVADSPAGPAAAGVANLNSVIFSTTRQVQTSFEARLASQAYSAGSGLPISWIAGAIYLDSATDWYDNEPVFGITKLFSQLGLNINDPNVFQGSFPGAWTAGDSSWYSHSHDNPSQRAAFGELNYYLRPDVHLTLGLRYESATETFEHDANYFYTRCGVADALGNTPGCPAVFSPTNAHFSATTPRAAITWNISDAKLLYASAAKGYREGAFNPPLNIRYITIYDLQNLGLCDGTPSNCAKVAPTSVRPDSLWSYELGSKSRFLGNRLSLDASLYLLKWNDTQQIIVLPVSEQDFQENVGHVQSYGAELTVNARVTPMFRVMLAGGFTRATFSDDVPALGSNNGVLNVMRGAKVPGTPEFTALVDADYAFSLSRGVSAFIRGDARLVGRSRGAFELGLPDYERPGYLTSDASIGVTVDRFELSMFVKNLNNAQTVFQRPTLNTVAEAYTMRPRTVGLALNYRFAER